MWHAYMVFTVLGPLLKHIITMATFNELVNYTEFHALPSTFGLQACLFKRTLWCQHV